MFWLSSISGNNSLSLYKNSVVHLYYLNKREIRSSRLGYKFFSNKKNVDRYEKKVGEVILEIKAIRLRYDKIKLGKLSNVDVRKELFAILRFLNKYGEAYLKTEAVYLEKFADASRTYGPVLKKLGDLRFSLRKKGEPVFYILLGVLLKEIARRFNLKFSDLLFYTINELKRTFSGKKLQERVTQDRKRGYALLFLRNKQTLLTGKKFKELYNEIILSKPKIEELRGWAAMKGSVSGKVHLILHRRRDISEEVAAFKRGEILVTEMTRPDTVLACKKAAAILTDEGGVTSHAAIISREFKIPCIVGTKIATQVLKDGDLVEVDADKGIVKILKKK